MELFIQIIGWLGAFMVVLAYFLITYGKVTNKNMSYQVLNFIGASMVGVNAYHQSALPSFGIQVVWTLVSIVGIINILRSYK